MKTFCENMDYLALGLAIGGNFFGVVTALSPFIYRVKTKEISPSFHLCGMLALMVASWYGGVSGNIAFLVMNVSRVAYNTAYLLASFMKQTTAQRAKTVGGVILVLILFALVIVIPYLISYVGEHRIKFYGAMSALGATIMFVYPLMKMIAAGFRCLQIRKQKPPLMPSIMAAMTATLWMMFGARMEDGFTVYPAIIGMIAAFIDLAWKIIQRESEDEEIAF